MTDTGRSAPLILIDGSSWLFRAFHALPPLTSPEGEPTGAVFGFFNMLRRLNKDYQPERFCVVFDPPGNTFRNDWYPQYKANRGDTPDDLKSQFPRIRELLDAMALPVITVDGVEADDVIGTLTAQARSAGLDVLIVSSDKDLAQLVGPDVHLLDTMKNRRLDPAGVVEKFGVNPGQIIDYLTLIGDTSDNIPGVNGVGPKTAAKWLAEYDSLDALLANADAIKGKAGERLREAADHLPLSKKLVTLVCDVALPVSLDTLVPGPADQDRVNALLDRLGFKGARELPRRTDEGELASVVAASASKPAAGAPPVASDAAAQVQTETECVLTETQLDDWVARLQNAELICVDTETDALDAHGARLVGIALATEAGKGAYIPVGHRYLDVPRQLAMDHVIARLKPLLEDPTRAKLGQNLKYDINVLARHGIRLRGVLHDTMLQSYVLDAGSHRHDMDSLAKAHLNFTTTTFSDVAGKGKQQLTFDQIALEQAAPYAAEDADITLRLHQVLFPRLSADPQLARVYETLERPLVPVLAAMEARGVQIDPNKLKALSAELHKGMERLEAEAFEAAGGPFNLGSPKQIGALLFDTLKLPVKARTPKGEPSTAEDVLEELSSEHPLPRLILDWRSLSKLRSTYTETLPQMVNPQTGRVHTSYQQAVAATGRLSSTDPNLQNIPIRTDAGREIRKAFIAAEGKALLAIDYSQIELRLMAHFSEDEKLINAFVSGQDIHRATAAEVFGLDSAAVTDDQRRAAKAINFGLIYGISAFGLARNIGVTRGEAASIIERFFDRYPGVKAYMDGTRAKAHEQGHVETWFGRRLLLPNIRARNAALRQGAERIAINAPLQGTAADLIKMAMIDLDAYLADTAPEVQMIMQVHDELVFEGPEAALRQHAQTIAERMCRMTPLKVPLVADFGIGAHWDAAHGREGSASS